MKVLTHISLPFSVPPIPILALLSESQGEITKDAWEKVKSGLLSLLSNAWQGGISKTMIEKAFDDASAEKMRKYIDLAEQLAGIMVTADHINGNPRLIKRFLNNLIIREKVARLNGITGIKLAVVVFPGYTFRPDRQR